MRCGWKWEARGGKILFRESVIFKNFAWINFRESTIFRIFAWINFRESGPIRENKSTRKLIHAKINPTKVTRFCRNDKLGDFILVPFY